MKKGTKLTTTLLKRRLLALVFGAGLSAGLGCATAEDFLPGDFDAGLVAAGGGGNPYSSGGATATSTGGYRATGGISGATGGSTGNGCAGGQKLCGSTCVTPSPSNGCAGNSCTACPAPAHSTVACVGGQCAFTCDANYTKNGSACVADPTCTDTTKNGTETDIDCGGSTCPKCDPGMTCSVDGDCAKGPCESTGKCGCTAATCAGTKSCSAALDDGCGTTLDCSGTCAATDVCYQELCCTPKTACSTTTCDPAFSDGCGNTLDCSNNCANSDVCYNKSCCTPKACGTQCGHPTDGCGTTLDCGLCADGKTCTNAADCSSNFCENGKCVSCSDNLKNHGESDVDCGGANCPTCANGKACTTSSDCASGKCCGLFDFGNCFLHTNTCQ